MCVRAEAPPTAVVDDRGVRIVALCLKNSARVPKLKTELKLHGLLEATSILENDRDVRDGIRGCFRSHQGACAAFLEDSSLEVLIVFEDDVIFRARREMGVMQALGEATRAIRTGLVEQVAIGGIPVSPLRHATGAVYHTVFQMTHAYAIGRVGADIVRRMEFSVHGRVLRAGDHIDHRMSMVLRQSLIYPTVAFQRAAEDATTGHSSSVVYYWMTVLRDLIGQRRVQIACETFFQTIGLLLHGRRRRAR